MKKDKRTLKPHPTIDRAVLQAWFVGFLAHEPRYAEARDRLAPLWLAATAIHPGLDPVPGFDALPTVPDPDDPLNAYIAGVCVETSGNLRCTTGGEPAPWVCRALHTSVTGASFPLMLAPPEERWIGELTIARTGSGAFGVMVHVDGQVIGDPTTTSHGDPFGQQWPLLKRLAHEQLDVLLDAFQARVEEATADWPRKYEKGISGRFETMAKLVRWLVGRESLFSGDREAVRRLRLELELDPP